MKRTMSLAIAASALTISCIATTVQAADPGFCRHYAGVAVEQFARAMSNPVCASRVGGPRWSPNYEQHFGWCLSARPWDAQHEQEARSRMLFHCMGG